MKHKIICGHVLDVLKTLPEESIDTVVTSPPYWGLRSYLPDDHPDKQKEIGLEPTLDLYINHLIEVMSELKRILKRTGVIFWNHGDCYGGSLQSWGAKQPSKTGFQKPAGIDERYIKGKPLNASITSKCMALQNYRFILRCVDELGLILRNVIIWYKPNHMPSSVKDRFTSSYEPVFMLVKSKEASNDIKEFIEPPVPDNWRAWLAAIVDAEGTIGIRRSRREKNHDIFAAYITVSNTNKELIKKCLKITGLGTIKDSSAGTNFPVYRWEVTHQKAISVIAEIYPYLIAKKEQAKVAIALQKTNKHRGNNKGTNRGPKPIGEKEYQEKVRLWELIKKLNQKEINESGLPEPNLNRYFGCERYWFDLDAVRLPHKESSRKRVLRAVGNKHKYLNHPEYSSDGGINKPRPNRRKLSIKFFELFDKPDREYHREQNMAISQYQYAEGNYLVVNLPPLGANPGDVWTISTQPFPEAHFATFSEKLVEPMIKAGCPRWICKKGGKPRERIVKSEKAGDSQKRGGYIVGGDGVHTGNVYSIPHKHAKKEFVGWTDCGCGAGWESGMVLDPFGGSGTVGIVAEKLGRNSILIDLNKEYCEMAYKRLKLIAAQVKLGEEPSIIERVGF